MLEKAFTIFFLYEYDMYSCLFVRDIALFTFFIKISDLRTVSSVFIINFVKKIEAKFLLQ